MQCSKISGAMSRVNVTGGAICGDAASAAKPAQRAPIVIPTSSSQSRTSYLDLHLWDAAWRRPIAGPFRARQWSIDHWTTVNDTPLLANPPAFTTTMPVDAPDGTVATMLLVVQEVAVAAALPNITVLEPCVAPKLIPAIVTDEPTLPVVGDSDTMDGVGVPVGLVGAVPGLRYWLWQPLRAIAPTAAPASTTILILLQKFDMGLGLF
jgi:hypothetical protein